MSDPVDLVHKCLHKKNAAAADFQQIRRIGRVGNMIDVKTSAEVADRDLESGRHALKLDLDRL